MQAFDYMDDEINGINEELFSHQILDGGKEEDNREFEEIDIP